MGGVMRRQILARTSKHPSPPRTHMPRKVRIEQRIVDADQVELNFATAAVP